ncbi:MAG TPA: Mov34/MPN/PAD-1 family protein [Candidatus Angelobacter sp.]|jgi:proteasome lid subunit RPN8/RPN11|nr:Mov34/MPN/PAD-1 family protein [Candidatus Angelobacter sp.]
MKPPEVHDQAVEIFWQESQHVYRPICNPLPEFLSTVEITSHHGFAASCADGPLLVFFEQSCMANIHQHAEQDILREQAGILCGHAYLSGQQPYLVIESAVAANTSSDAAHFKFHQHSWHAIWEHLGNGSNIVGWYHTHPAMGIFLSPTDLRTQQLYFSSLWQIAVVVDPVSRKMGVFHGATGTLLSEDQWFSYVRKP